MKNSETYKQIYQRYYSTGKDYHYFIPITIYKTYNCNIAQNITTMVNIN